MLASPRRFNSRVAASQLGQPESEQGRTSRCSVRKLDRNAASWPLAIFAEADQRRLGVCKRAYRRTGLPIRYLGPCVSLRTSDRAGESCAETSGCAEPFCRACSRTESCCSPGSRYPGTAIDSKFLYRSQLSPNQDLRGSCPQFLRLAVDFLCSSSSSLRVSFKWPS